MIKIMQEWKGTALLDENVNIWDIFIKPKELISVLQKYKLVNQKIKGLAPGMNFIAHYLNLRKRAKGMIFWQILGEKLNLRVNNNLSSTYMGCAKEIE